MVIEKFYPSIEGLSLAQNEHITCFELLKQDNPVNVIEIGTCRGGFALFLKKTFFNSDVHTFDIRDWGDAQYLELRNKLYNENQVHYYNEDCFLHEGRRIKSLLENKSILICDGGHKINEFAFFSPFLKKDSIIMVHDYGKNEEYFNEVIKENYWHGGMEFDGSQFDQWCTDHSLVPYYQDEFEKAVFFIRKKV